MNVGVIPSLRLDGRAGAGGSLGKGIENPETLPKISLHALRLILPWVYMVYVGPV
ncbi:MAG: hypothetical protein ACJAU0_000695 [Flavobacteriales bacterium]